MISVPSAVARPAMSTALLLATSSEGTAACESLPLVDELDDSLSELGCSLLLAFSRGNIATLCVNSKCIVAFTMGA